MTSSPANYKRVLIKLSGEALMADLDYGIDAKMLARVASEIAEVVNMGVEVALVIGGGNIFRMQDALEKQGMTCRVMSAIKINRMCEEYVQRRAVRHLEKGRIVIFAAGIGNPFFTTDTAGCLRAVEIGADSVLKATKVDGVYDSDPMKNPDAKRYESLTFDEVLDKNLQVMDATAIVLCRDNNMPLRIFNLNEVGSLPAAMKDQTIGTTVIMGDK